MTHRERVLAALSGDEVDRVPVSAWWHDYRREWTVEGLVQAMVDIHNAYDWDYMKVYPRHSFCVEDWGVVFRPVADDMPGQCVSYPIQDRADWLRLKVLPPEEGVLGEHLRGLRAIRGAIGDAPMLQTISNPLTVATLLVGNDPNRLMRHICDHPDAVHSALAAIAETFAEYSRQCLRYGADGIFFATTDWATQQYLDAAGYEEFGRPYDLHLLEGAQHGATFNLVHLCGDNILFDILSAYPTHAVHWGATLPGNPSFVEARKRTNKALMGGVSEQTTLRTGSTEEVVAEVGDALKQTAGRHYLLAPGCTVHQETPEANLRMLRRAVDDLAT